MTYLKRFGFLALMLGLFFTSCTNDDTVDPKTPTYEIPVNDVIASLSGVVTNENGDGIENATIEVGSTRVITDENGVFIFKGIKMNEFGTLVKITKPGYFLGAQMVETQAGENSSIRVKLMQKNIVGTVDASSGGTVTANDDSKVTLPANGIVTSSGSTYTGMVSVAARWIDPTSKDLSAIMPGDLRAIDSEEEAVQLATFGMLAVELESASGEELNIAEGSVASLEFPVPAELQADAPATIPLWSFDESIGYWVEEGTATFDGTKYVGEVSHFSFWNCDAPFPLVNMQGSVEDVNGNPLEDINVSIKVNSSGYTRGGNTNESGIFSGKIPKDEELTISIKIFGQCDDALYSDVIGPFSTDVVLSAIVIDPAGATSYTYLAVTGQVEKCAGGLVTNGYVKLDHNGYRSMLVVDDAGQFNSTLLYCGTSPDMTVTAFDFDDEQQSNLLTYSVPAGATTLDLGTITTCEAVVERIDYTIDGNAFSLIDPSAQLDIDQLIIQAYGPDSSNVAIQVQVAGLGTYNPSWTSFAGMLTNGDFVDAYCQGCPDFEVTVTALGDVGEVVEGTFNGTMVGSAGPATTVSGSFKAIRE